MSKRWIAVVRAASVALGVLCPAGIAVAADPARDAGGAEIDPVLACYRAAIGAARQAHDCDLAVQVARSGGPRALAGALVNRALVLIRDGRLEAALEDLDQAAAATPDEALVYADRGNLLMRLGRPADALVAHDRAVALAPGDPVSYYNRAFAYRMLGDDANAVTDLERARQLLAEPVRSVPGEDAGRDR